MLVVGNNRRTTESNWKNKEATRCVYNMGKSTLVIGTIFVVLGFLCNFIAFVSPYWLVSEERANNPFQRIGLWEACLKDFVDPKDYVSKLYNGCWWIFWPEYIEIRYWLNPREYY